MLEHMFDYRVFVIRFGWLCVDFSVFMDPVEFKVFLSIVVIMQAIEIPPHSLSVHEEFIVNNALIAKACHVYDAFLNARLANGHDVLCCLEVSQTLEQI